ncbi:hypothetical protein SERLADRAFT_444076 [Serpula lacrymans var. lacrymans S7.9]|uniref:Uncharacterized protein n=1 Tax=Serpula lacrymans var. lacrymans (strain S7.9) TaxID=578457 RepID=F8PEF7_SERL9|nr:uncharacterized protein SERLADRAFT_444076 [Serpula lacrymans var. lacrymans S7.9]EGO18489.1 hypothetical protein SERLADRAFT_444076 [Serpula lacrymans var. lacrymans S7.9]
MQFSKNAVPKELLSETKYSDDMETLEKGVKDVEAPGASSVVDIEEDEDTEVDNEEPAVIPLQALVVLDLIDIGKNAASQGFTKACAIFNLHIIPAFSEHVSACLTADVIAKCIPMDNSAKGSSSDNVGDEERSSTEEDKDEPTIDSAMVGDDIEKEGSSNNEEGGNENSVDNNKEEEEGELVTSVYIHVAGLVQLQYSLHSCCNCCNTKSYSWAILGVPNTAQMHQGQLFMEVLLQSSLHTAYTFIPAKSANMAQHPAAINFYSRQAADNNAPSAFFIPLLSPTPLSASSPTPAKSPVPRKNAEANMPAPELSSEKMRPKNCSLSACPEGQCDWPRTRGYGETYHKEGEEECVSNSQ